MVKGLLTALVAVAIFSVSWLWAGNEDVIGEWDCEVYVDMTYPFTLTMQEEDGALTGTTSNDQGSLPIVEPTYDQGKLTFKLNTPDYGMIDFAANVVDGKISGTLEGYSFQGQLSCDRPE